MNNAANYYHYMYEKKKQKTCKNEKENSKFSYKNISIAQLIFRFLKSLYYLTSNRQALMTEKFDT